MRLVLGHGGRILLELRIMEPVPKPVPAAAPGESMLYDPRSTTSAVIEHAVPAEAPAGFRLAP